MHITTSSEVVKEHSCEAKTKDRLGERISKHRYKKDCSKDNRHLLVNKAV